MAKKKKSSTPPALTATGAAADLGKYFAGLSKTPQVIIQMPEPKAQPVTPTNSAGLGTYFAGVSKMPTYKTAKQIQKEENIASYSRVGDSVFESSSNDYMGVPGLSPQPIIPEVFLKVTAPVKIATPQYVDFSINAQGGAFQGIPNLFLEKIAGFELLIASNRNFINTVNISYQPIINVSAFKNTYDPKKIIALQDTLDVYFLNFIINLLARIPEVPTSSSTNGTNVYMTAAGDIVIETKDNETDERVEIQILSDGTIYNDTLLYSDALGGS